MACRARLALPLRPPRLRKRGGWVDKPLIPAPSISPTSSNHFGNSSTEGRYLCGLFSVHRERQQHVASSSAEKSVSGVDVQHTPHHYRARSIE
jgi:hypothetical protein